jgi:hypothetical protein
MQSLQPQTYLYNPYREVYFVFLDILTSLFDYVSQINKSIHKVSYPAKNVEHDRKSEYDCSMLTC